MPKTTTNISLQLLDPACLPQRKTSGAVGYDLVAREAAFLYKGQVALIPVGFALELPPGTEAQIRPRSGLNAKGILALYGTVDSDYRGEVKVILLNAAVISGFQVNPGDRIAQMVIASVLETELVLAEKLTDTERGAGGFGSTGVSTSTPPTLTAVVATEEDLKKLEQAPSVQEAIWAENQREAAMAYHQAHPFSGDLNNGTDS